MKKIVIVLVLLLVVFLTGCNKVDYEQAYGIAIEENRVCNARVVSLSSQEITCAEKVCPEVKCNASEVIKLMGTGTNSTCMLQLEKAEKYIDKLEILNNTLDCMNIADDLTNCELKLNRTEAKLKEIEDLI